MRPATDLGPRSAAALEPLLGVATFAALLGALEWAVKAGKVNAAPFSCYTFVSSQPPLVAVITFCTVIC